VCIQVTPRISVTINPGYRSRGLGFDSRLYHIFWEVVGLERGPFSLVSTIEEVLGRNSSGSGPEIREYGRRDPSRWPRGTVYPQIWHYLSRQRGGRLIRYSSLKDKSHGVIISYKSINVRWITKRSESFNYAVFVIRICRAFPVSIAGKWSISILFHQNAARFVLTAVLSVNVPKLTAASRLGRAFATPLPTAPLQDRNCNMEQMNDERKR
jgi:hypothetical protein